MCVLNLFLCEVFVATGNQMHLYLNEHCGEYSRCSMRPNYFEDFAPIMNQHESIQRNLNISFFPALEEEKDKTTLAIALL